MKSKISAVLLWMVWLTANAYAQTVNSLSVPDITAGWGCTMSMPIKMENKTDIVAVQFTLSVPEGVTINPNQVVKSERLINHTVTVREIAHSKYAFLIMSDTNETIRGYTGTLFTVEMNVGRSIDDGSVNPMTITDAIMCLRSGENVLQSATAGSITIAHATDFIVRDVTFNQNGPVSPDEEITFSWKVGNIGELASKGGWHEQLILVGNKNEEERLLTTIYNDTILLEPGAIVSRVACIRLPQLLGMDGDVNIRVRLVPNSDSGERAEAQGNNMATSKESLWLNKKLSIVLPTDRIDEGGKSLNVILQRTGSWKEEETFSIDVSGDDRLQAPTAVTIPATQSAITFQLKLTDNEVLDKDSLFVLTAEGNGYEKVSRQLTIEDNEYPSLEITTTNSVITEGESFQLTITASRASATPISVTLSSENSKRFSYPSMVTIPAGETTISVDVRTVDDELPSLELSNVFIVSAPKYNRGEVIVLLKDNDLPVLELQLSPSTVSEDAGVVTVAGVLRRTTNTNSKITVKLSDDADGGLYFGNRTLELAKGVEEVHFNFGPVDNTIVDGDRTYTITASVWISSCSCSAAGESAGSVSAQLTVLDNDGPALNLTSSLSTVKEGGTTMLTVSRNTTDISQPLTVTLSSDYDAGLSYDHTIIIPAGKRSAMVEVTSTANDIQNDSRTVVFTVQTEGYAKGTCYVLVTDQTLPDACISSISANIKEADVGTKAILTIEITNRGAALLPAEVPVTIYRRGYSDAVATLYTSENIPVGSSKTLTKTITLPQTVGPFNYYAVVNVLNKIQELSYNNNTSADVIITTVTPFFAVVSTDKSVYMQGEKVIVTGQLTGKGTANTSVDLYLIDDGARQVQSVTTNADGTFHYEWQLYTQQSGHFIMGACYPGESLKEEMASFDVYGLRRTENSFITCELLVGDTYYGEIEIENPCSIRQENVLVELLSEPSDCVISFDPIGTIEGSERTTLKYQIKGMNASSGNDWNIINACVKSNSGASLPFRLYYYCRIPQAQLDAGLSRIETSIVQGTSREYPITITNRGAGESGMITLALPSFMSVQSSQPIPSLLPNESTTIILLLSSTDEMQTNVPISDFIGLNCENGKGVALPYTIVPVSESNGELFVDVCDEYTYYTEEKPHVSGANVKIQRPLTNEVLYEGITDSDGTYLLNLPEGYYSLSVTADNHESYVRNILIDPARRNTIVVNLSYEGGVSVDWDVVETEMEDEYTISSTISYETNVPVPILDLDIPNSIPANELSIGESLVFYTTLTNRGLITIHEAQIILPEDSPGLVFESLQEIPVDLSAQQAIIIPVKVTRVAFNTSSRRSNNENDNEYKLHCAEFIVPTGYWDCGVDKKWYRRGGKGLNLGTPCTSVELSGGFEERSELPLLGRISGANFNPYIPNIPEIFPPININYDGCEPCLQSRFVTIVDCALGFIPFWDYIEIVNESIDFVQNGTESWMSNTNRLLSAIGYSLDRCASNAMVTVVGAPVSAACETAGIVVNIIQCLLNLSEPCTLGELPHSSRKSISGNYDYEEPSYISTLRQASGVALKEVNGFMDVMLEYFGDSVWVTNTTIEEQFNMLTEIAVNTKEYYSVEELKEYKPEGITMKQFSFFVERLNNSIRYEQTGLESNNRIHQNIIDDAWEKIGLAEKEAIAMGYASVNEMFQTILDDSYKKIAKNSESVCASISLHLDQRMTMTRQAFRGTLTVFNGNENTAMQNVKLTLSVTNMTTGYVATSHEFQINPESLKGFSGELDFDSGWTLGANETGTATLLFVPTKYAAPTESIEWSFGGTLSYIDPFTGLEVIRELFPMALTVKPSPELDLTYFMQRDIYGDDPLTLDVVEPIVPAEFSLLINNKGNGDATNVHMVTQQPEIIDNEKGLNIDFEIVSSQVNGSDANLAFSKSIANDFGTIPTHSQAYAQWWMTSTQLGHFTSYDVQASHITSYGNEDLSLLGDVTIHELIRSLDLSADGKKMVGFLVNDITDSEDLPDMLYLSNGETLTVSIASASQMSKTSITTYNLTITPSATGWTYGNIKDPTQGLATLKSIVRQRDGKEINLRNFWQTDRTLRDGKDPLYEYRIHFADEFTGTTPETYILTFDPTPDMVLAVSSITTIPEEGNITEEPIDELTVTFNKKIDASTFTGEDITFAVQGVKQDANQIGIATTDNQSFTLDMSEINPSLSNGYYTLTVQTNEITDTEGFQGKNGKQVGWILFRGGLVQLLTSAYPENSGTVKRKTSATADARGLAPVSEKDDNTARYGSTVTLVAEPATGYEFANWTLNGEVVSTDAEFETKALGDMNVVANFTKKKYMVNVNVEGTGGTTEGTATGIYEYGTEVNVTAVPDEDFMLKGWSVNGKAVEGSGNKLTVTANDALDIDVTFMQEFYRQSLTLAKGWNWISAYLYEPLNISEMSHYANRIISQTGELINDPEFGLVGNITEMTAGQAYKIEANSRFTNSFRGHLYDVIAQPINLHKGWNWIPFPFKEKAPIDALTSAEDGDYITSQTGFSEFADGTWEGTLNMFTPGNGYMYKSVSGKNMTFDTSMSISNSRAWVARRTDVTEQDIDIHRYPNTMNVTARIYQNGTELQGDVYCIYAVVGDELRGISQYISGNHYLTVYGDEPVDITFLVESTETAETFLANEVLTFRNDVVGSRKSPFAITFNNATGINSFDNSKTMTVYTVEGVLISRNATLKTLRRLPKGIYIVNGQKRYVK